MIDALLLVYVSNDQTWPSDLLIQTLDLELELRLFNRTQHLWLAIIAVHQ